MKCEETKKLIYLYDVITSLEKEKADRHMQTCQECMQFYHRMEQERTLIKRAASVRHQVQDAEKLTTQIMSSIKPRQAASPGFAVNLLDIFDLSLTRYAMTAMSLMLIVFFLYEQRVPLEGENPARKTIAVSDAGLRNTDVSDQSGVTSQAALKKQRALQERLPLSFLNAASSLSLLRDKQFLQFTENYLKEKNDQSISLFRELNRCVQQCKHDEKQNCDDCKMILNQLIQKYESL